MKTDKVAQKGAQNISSDDNFSLITFFKENKSKFWIIVSAAFLYAFATTSILTKAATIPTGLSAVSMTISFIVPVIKPYINFIYLGLNVPLFLIFWKKVKKKYLYITLTFLLLNAIFGFFIGFDFGQFCGHKDQGSLDYFISQYVLIFCPPSNEHEWAYANAHHIKNMSMVKINDFNQFLVDNGLDLKAQTNLPTGRTIGVERGWPIFVYTLTGVALAGLAGGLGWKCGGSTGGTDIIAYYFSTKKKKPAGTILSIIGALIVSTSILIVWLLSAYGPTNIRENINGFDTLLSLQTLSSAIFVFMFGKMINLVYPKYTKVLIKIDTLHLEKIKKYFNDTNFNHPYKIHTLTSGRTGRNIYSIETVILLLEAEDLIKDIRKVDPTAWISKMDIKKIYGSFDYSKVE